MGTLVLPCGCSIMHSMFNDDLLGIHFCEEHLKDKEIQDGLKSLNERLMEISGRLYKEKKNG